MEQEHFEQMLEQCGVKPTANRIIVARTLAAATRPMSLSELENQIVSIDKSGVFRTLRLFAEHHLVHIIDDGSGGTRYELCHCDHHADEDADLHPHFYCEQCRRTFCLRDVPLPHIATPEGFRVLSVNYIVKGICPQCQQPHRA